MMERDQLHMAAHTQADKLVYYGVDLGPSSASGARRSARSSAGAVDREMQALEERLDDIDAIMAESRHSEAARRCSARWSGCWPGRFALGCPIPVPTTDETERSRPGLGRPGRVRRRRRAGPPSRWARRSGSRRAMGDRPVIRHVVVLTVCRMGEI